MSGTTMFHVKQACVERVRAAELDGVTVLFGGKVTTTFTKGSIVSFGDITFTRAPATMTDIIAGEPSLDESYSIDGVIEVCVTGTDQELATQTACELLDTVDALFRTRDETLGVPGVQYARLSADGRVVEAKDQKTLQVGRSAAIPFTVRVLGLI